MKIEKEDINKVLMVTIATIIYTIGFNTFVSSGNLFPGGFAGLSRLISRILFEFTNINISFGFIYFTLNILLTIGVFKYIGKKFLALSILWFTLTSIFTNIFPAISLTSDMLLISVFGGILNGLAIGIALRNNASSGGTDFIAIVASMKYNKPTWNYVMCLNAIILIVAGFLFGWNQALYSIIFQFCSTQVINTLHKRYKLSNLFIITEKPEEVSKAIFKQFRHGITKIDAEGEFKHHKNNLLFMTINTYQLKGVVEAIKQVDPKVFISVSSCDQIVGNYYQKPLD